MHLQSIALLLSDLRCALVAEQPKEALRRIALFEMMHMGEDHDAREEMPNRKRLVLRIETNEIIVCDEYYPHDQGRVHMIPAHKYGHFNRDAMTLDFQKVSMDVSEIIYEGSRWPDDMPANSPATVIAYFTGTHV